MVERGAEKGMEREISKKEWKAFGQRRRMIIVGARVDEFKIGCYRFFSIFSISILVTSKNKWKITSKDEARQRERVGR